MRYNRGKILFGFHDLMVFSFRLTVILTLFCFGYCKCSFLVKVGSINSIFISCIRQQNPLTVLSKIILRKVKQFNLPPKKK